MTVFVKTKRVPVASMVVNLPVFESLGSNLTIRSKRGIIYENVLEKEEEAMLGNFAALAKSLGIKLEVKDLARPGLFRILLGFVSRNKSAAKTPSVSLAGGAMALLAYRLDQQKSARL